MAQHWTDKLPRDIYSRLCACTTKESDLEILVNHKWAFMKEIGKDKEGFTKEDALIMVLEHLECNGNCFDLDKGTYIALKSE